MRFGQSGAFGLLLVLLAGCTTGQSGRSTSWLDRFRQCPTPAAPGMVHMDVALIERPVGDPYINQDLWNSADEQVVDLERKGALEDAGFRVGQVGGITPVGLLALLTSEKSCAAPRRIQCHPGKATALTLGQPVAFWQLPIERDGEPTTIELEQARCVLDIVPTATADGRTRIRFSPRVQHGESKMVIHPTEDRSTWMLKSDQPIEDFPALGFEVTVPANDYIVVGGRFDRPDSLGQQFFIRGDEPVPVQRLLVIRTGRPLPGPEETPVAADGARHRAAPLAFQAACTVRGTAP